jgi:hypothetical protein
MKTLDKTFNEDRLRLAIALRGAADDVRAAIDRFNDTLDSEGEVVQAAVRIYNQLVAEAQSMRDDAVVDLQDHFEGRSEKWQESEKGEAFRDWITDLEELELDEIDLELPSPLDEPDMPAADSLEQCRTEL